MNISTYKPNDASDWDTTLLVDPPGHIWFMYCWTDRGTTSDFNNQPGPEASAENSTAYPALGARLDSFKSLRHGTLSYVAFGPSSDIAPSCFFLRATDTWGVWYYRWAGLPDECDIAVQKQIQGGPRHEDLDEDDCIWPNGRLRAVEFGFGGSWVVYRGKIFQWHEPLHKNLRSALQRGLEKEWSINVSSGRTLWTSSLILSENLTKFE